MRRVLLKPPDEIIAWELGRYDEIKLSGSQHNSETTPTPSTSSSAYALPPTREPIAVGAVSRRPSSNRSPQKRSPAISMSSDLARHCGSHEPKPPEQRSRKTSTSSIATQFLASRNGSTPWLQRAPDLSKSRKASGNRTEPCSDMRQSGAVSQKAPTSTSSPRSTTFDAQSEVDDLVWITSEDIDDYARSMAAFEKVSCLHKPRLEDLDSLFRYLREDRLGKMKAKDFISIFINVYAESLSLWADLDYVIGKLKPNSTISRRQAEIFRAVVQIGDFIHQIPGEGQEWDAEVEPSTPMAAVEHLKKMVDSVKAMTRTAWLNLKPLPQLPTDDNASFLDESDEESVYYDAPEGRLSVFLVAQTDNTLAEFRYPFAPPATSTQIIHRKEPSFHTPSVSMSSTSCHTKVNSVSTTSTAATHCNSLPLEVVFNELGIGMVVAGEVKRGLAQQFKAKAAKSMVSLLSTSTKKAASTIEFPDSNAYAESTVSPKKQLKGSLYRLKQFGNSKVSLLSPIKARKSPTVTKLEGHALLPEWMHDDGGFLETEDFTMIRQSLVNYPDWDQCSPSLQELLPAPKRRPESKVNYDSFGRITSCTVEGIAVVLSRTNVFSDPSLLHSVFSNFRSEMTAIDLAGHLHKLYIDGPSGSLEGQELEDEKRLLRTRVAKLLLFWFHYHWDDAQDRGAIDPILDLQDIVNQTDYIPPIVKAYLTTATALVLDGQSPGQTRIGPKNWEHPSPCDSPFHVSEEPSQTLLALKAYNTSAGRAGMAHQLTIMLSELYGRVEPKALVDFWSLTSIEKEPLEGFQSAPSIVRVLAIRDFAEALRYWVASTILTPLDVPGRVEMIEFWLDVAMICLGLKNYGCASYVADGVSYSSVRKLKRTIMDVPEESKAKYHKLQQIFDQHHSKLKESEVRKGMEECMNAKQPFIPFPGQIIRDLHAERANNDRMKELPAADNDTPKLFKVSQDNAKSNAILSIGCTGGYGHLGRDEQIQAWIAGHLVHWGDSWSKIKYEESLEEERKKREPRAISDEREIDPLPQYREPWDYFPSKSSIGYDHIDDKIGVASRAKVGHHTQPTVLQTIKTGLTATKKRAVGQ